MAVRLIMFVLLSVFLGQMQAIPNDSLLAILCKRVPLFGTQSPSCADFYRRLDAQTSTPPPVFIDEATTTVEAVTPNEAVTAVKMLGAWAQALIGLTSGILTIYGTLVSYFRFRRGCDCIQSFSLGLFKGQNNTSMDCDANNIPLRVFPERRPTDQSTV